MLQGRAEDRSKFLSAASMDTRIGHYGRTRNKCVETNVIERYRQQIDLVS
jgi:hypothetical protein